MIFVPHRKYTSLRPVAVIVLVLYVDKSGVPQGSVLGPLLYLLYTADLPTTVNTTIATFADDTALLATNSDLTLASQQLQYHLDLLQELCHKWKIKINQTKSSQITFTTKRTNCPPVTIIYKYQYRKKSNIWVST
jgi:hypothetical protein